MFKQWAKYVNQAYTQVFKATRRHCQQCLEFLEGGWGISKWPPARQASEWCGDEGLNATQTRYKNTPKHTDYVYTPGTEALGLCRLTCLSSFRSGFGPNLELTLKVSLSMPLWRLGGVSPAKNYVSDDASV